MFKIEITFFENPGSFNDIYLIVETHFLEKNPQKLLLMCKYLLIVVSKQMNFQV